MKAGVAVPPWGEPAVRYSALREFARLIEERGLDSLWVYDHMLVRRRGRGLPAAWKPGHCCRRWPRPPNEWSWGCWSRPRCFVTGCFREDDCHARRSQRWPCDRRAGEGWHQPEFDGFGIPFDHFAKSFLEEAMHIIKPLLRDGRVDFTGRFYQAPDCELIPRGPRPAGPPLLLADNRPRMLDIVAQHAEMWNTAWHAEPDRRARAPGVDASGVRAQRSRPGHARAHPGTYPGDTGLGGQSTPSFVHLGANELMAPGKGRLEFVAIGAAIVLRTGTETTQSKREGSGLLGLGAEYGVSQGAFQRAQRDVA